MEPSSYCWTMLALSISQVSGSLWGLQEEMLLNIPPTREFETPLYIAFILGSPSEITTIVSRLHQLYPVGSCSSRTTLWSMSPVIL